MTIIEEGVTLPDDVLEVIAYMAECFDLLEAGEEIRGDPFYARKEGRPPITDEMVERVIKSIDDEYAHEIGAYPGYHRNRSGSTMIADFSRLSPQSKRAMVEQIDAIFQRYDQKITEAQGGSGGC